MQFSITDILKLSEDQTITKKRGRDMEKPILYRYFDIEDIIK